MNDKEKQIEEMAKRIHIATDLYYIECIKIATHLFEKDNCRIVDKDNIVLSKEEYKKLKDLEKCFEYNLVQERKQVRKETTMDIFQWLKEHTFDDSFAIIETYFKEQYGVDLGK